MIHHVDCDGPPCGASGAFQCDSCHREVLRCHIGRGRGGGLTADACCVCCNQECGACEEAKRG